MMQKYQKLKIHVLLQADYNEFAKDIVDNSIKSKTLVDKSTISGFINNADLDKRVATLAMKAELNANHDKIIKLQVLDSSYFRGKSHFEDDGTQTI